MQALLNFANDTPASGPISNVAARQGMSPGGLGPASAMQPPAQQGHEATPPPLSPKLVFAAPATAPTTAATAAGWNPLLNPGRAAEQAKAILQKLVQWSTQKSLNPWWGVQFWQDVARMEVTEPMEPDLMRALRGQGYQGAHTLGAPRDELKTILERFRDGGNALLGSGGFPGAPPGMGDAMEFSMSDDRWQQGLPPDMTRAAPDIYRMCRAEGVSNMREWLSGRYKGERSQKNPEWTDLWNAASEVDFTLLRNKGYEAAILASDDGLEMKLRRLASYAHLVRTGDLQSATMFLAIKPPGAETDVAPTWLANEATLYSKAEHQRSERVRQSKPKGKGKKGKGKGKGKGEKEV